MASTIRYFTDEALYSMDDIWHGTTLFPQHCQLNRIIFLKKGILRGDTQRYLRFKNDAKKRTRVCTEKQVLSSTFVSYHVQCKFQFFFFSTCVAVGVVGVVARSSIIVAAINVDWR